MSNLTESMTLSESPKPLQHNIWKIFSQTQSFDTSLPLCSFFIERSPYSNLSVAPRVNVRQVDPLSYGKTSKGKTPIIDAIAQKNNTTFSARKMVIYPFVITKKDDPNDKGIPLVSVARGDYIYKNKTLKNTSVVVTNIKAINIKPFNVRCLAALFNHSTYDPEEHIINWEKLLQKNLPLTNTQDLILFVEQHKFPKDLIQISFRFEVNMRNVASFIRMCTNIRFCQPEGQHRMECASRVLYGYPLLGTAPLLDPTDKVLETCNMNELRANHQSVPDDSTVFGNIPCNVYYPSAGMIQAFDITHLKMLKDLSSTVQTQTLLEVESSYHSFYLDLNQDINKDITDQNIELLSETDWANLSLKQSKDPNDSKTFEDDQQKLLDLHEIINTKTLHRIYKSLPFNKDLPKTSDKEQTTLPLATFLEHINNHDWPTNSLKWKLYQTNLYGGVKGHPTGSGMSSNYFEIRHLCSNISNTHDQALSTANWKSLQVHILFDLFFAMKTEKKASETLNKFVSFGDSDDRFYNPYWLAAYVFAPINTICENMVIRLTQPLDITKGAMASSKQKLFLVLKRLLVVEYFNVIMKYANKEIGKNNKSFLQFKKKQNTGIEELQPTEAHKKFVKGLTFMDMLLLTLPEKIMDHCKAKKKQSIVPTNNFKFVARSKGCYDANHIPTIDTFIPNHLLPSTILANANMVTNYSTPQLSNIGKKNTPARKKNSNTSAQGETITGENGDEDFQPPTEDTTVDNPHNVNIGKLCQDHVTLIENGHIIAKNLRWMKKEMVKAKLKKEFFTKLEETTIAATIIEKTTLDHECTTALDAFKALNPQTRKRKHKKDDEDDNNLEED